MKKRRRTFYMALAALLVIASTVALIGGMHWRWYRTPYNSAGKIIAWAMGTPELAYNFDTVVSGKLYRSALPDTRFLDYARQRYGIRHIVSLSGASEVHSQARALGMQVTVLHWRGTNLPIQDLALLLKIFDGDKPVLVHCHAGRDRSGYAIAVYRVRRQHWALERAIADMEAHGHSRRHHLETDRVLRQALGSLHDTPADRSL